MVQPSRSPYLLAYRTVSCNGVLNMDNGLFTFWSVLLLFQIRTIPILFGEENSRYLQNLVSIWTTNPLLSQGYKNNMLHVSMLEKFQTLMATNSTIHPIFQYAPTPPPHQKKPQKQNKWVFVSLFQTQSQNVEAYIIPPTC